MSITRDQQPFPNGPHYIILGRFQSQSRLGSLMGRNHRPAKGRASDDETDPLDAALRQMGADILDEPVPERLRELLRRARGDSNGKPDSGSAKPKSEAGRG